MGSYATGAVSMQLIAEQQIWSAACARRGTTMECCVHLLSLSSWLVLLLLLRDKCRVHLWPFACLTVIWVPTPGVTKSSNRLWYGYLRLAYKELQSTVSIVARQIALCFNKLCSNQLCSFRFCRFFGQFRSFTINNNNINNWASGHF